jgi:hypothetical protein
MFEAIAWTSLGVAFVCAVVIAIDVGRHPQQMGIMNVVWPVSALYGSVFVLWAYFRIGRKKAKEFQEPSPEADHHSKMKEAQRHPQPVQIAIASSHCGAGCVLGDIGADFLVFGLAIKLAGSDLIATFVIDFVFAWALGVAFQYFTIAPMRGLSLLPGIWAAIKADTLSITAWQVGMYGFMMLTYFVFFPHSHLHPNQPQYWLMMQFAMIVGFITAYPMNYVLIKTGLKESMA